MTQKKTVLLLSCFLLSSCSSFFSAINYSPSNKIDVITFSNKQDNQDYSFYFSDTLKNMYLKELRQNYGLDTMTSDISNEIDKIKIILNWCSNQWEHNGSNSPSKSDALTILNEAKSGKQFRCVEYGILAAASLNSIGIYSRILGLKTRDVAKVKSGAGHVVAETYSEEYSKWIFIDPQFDVLPTVKGIPLNAVEFQKAILNDSQDIELVNSNGIIEQEFAASYIKWIGKYLYFFDTGFDQRINFDLNSKEYNGKTRLMLVPLEAENPTVFQRNYNINYCIYTNSAVEFYMPPTPLKSN